MKTIAVQIGTVAIGGSNPIRIQTMTNTNTEDIEKTVEQIKELVLAGAELIRLAVNTPAAAKAVPKIRKKLYQAGFLNIPLIGDFHFNGHILLERFPDCAITLDKYRINPGNVGNHFDTFIRLALQHKKPIRIGLNWGSFNLPSQNIHHAMVDHAIQWAKKAESLGMPSNRIVLSVKTSEVQDTVQVYEQLHQRCKTLKTMYPLHLGLTEAGSGMKGLISSAAALSILLQQKIGDTIRVSITPKQMESRTEEIKICQQILQSLGLRYFRPQITSCPGCGRTNHQQYQTLASHIENFISKNHKKWKKKYSGIEKLSIAVMGCVVNGPGESKKADLGIMLPGTSEQNIAHVYKKGKFFKTLQNTNLLKSFQKILIEHLEECYSV